MELNEKKELMREYGVKLEKAIKKELSVKKELENDKLLLKHLGELKAGGVEFTNDVYENYDSWIAAIEKQVKRSENSLVNIEFKRVELEAVKMYAEQN